MTTNVRHNNLGRKLFRIFIKSVLFLVLFLLLIVLLVHTPPAQRLIKNKLVAYLERELKTEVSIGKVYIGLPKHVVAEDVYIEDRQKDTLVSAGKLKIDIALLKLAFKKEISINTIELSNSTVKLKRELQPDTSFNFQFVIDAFTPAPDTSTADSSSSAISINSISLNNIRCVYQDVVNGSNAIIQLEHFDTRLGKIDPSQMKFEVSTAKIDGLTGSLIQRSPLAAPETLTEDIAEAKKPVALDLAIGELELSKIRFNYQNDVSAAYALLDLADMNIEMNKIDMAERLIHFKKVEFKNSGTAFRIGKKEAGKVLVSEAKKEIAAQQAAGWKILIDEADLVNNTLSFDNDNMTPISYGMDYNHIKADSFRLFVEDFIFNSDSIGGKIRSASFIEKSGFVLQQLQTECLYSSTESYLKELYLQTPGTELRRKAAIYYTSPQMLKDDIGKMVMDVDIRESKVQVKDILTFAPALRKQEAFANPNATWYINTRLRGNIDALQIDFMQIQGLKETAIDMRGHISGLVSARSPNANLVIESLSTSQSDIETFVPADRFPDNIALPERINLNGNIVTRGSSMLGDLRVSSSLGTVLFKGEVANWNNKDRISYKANVHTASFDAGTFLRNKDLFENVNASFTASGNGTDPKTMNLALAGKIESAIIRNYTYRNIQVDATLNDQQLKSKLWIKDPNIHVTADAKANLSEAKPALIAQIMVDSIKFQPLQLTKDNIIYRGKLDANFPVADISAPQGNLLITQSLLVNQEKRFQLDTVRLYAGITDSGRYMTLNSALANVSLEGQYDLVELPSVLTQAIQPYFTIAGADNKPVNSSYDFQLNGTITNNKAWNALLPDLGRLQPITVQSHFSSATGLNATVNVPLIEIRQQRITDLSATATTTNNTLSVNASVQHFYINQNLQLGATSLSASVANNNIDFILNSKDQQQRNKYNISGMVQYTASGQYTFNLRPDNLLLNYDNWTISPNNRTIINGNDIRINDFLLSNAGQQIRLESRSAQRNAPLQATFSNFQLLTITGLVQADSTFADGILNGNIVLEQISPRPVFTADLTVNDLRIKNDTTGNLHLLVNNRTSNTYTVSATLSGRENDLEVQGTYLPYATVNNLDLDVELRKLSASTVEAFSNGAIYNGSGSMNGDFSISGSLAKPVINGDLNFTNTVFGIRNLNDHFAIHNEKISINSEGINLSNFIIKDSAGNEMRMDGKIATTDFTHFQFDTRLRASNFRLLNSTKKENKELYGQLYVDANLNLKGTESLPAIDGRLTINENTKMTVMLPQKEPEIVRREGIVEFVSFNSPNDSLFLQEDSIYIDFFQGVDVSMTIETSKEADFTLIIDEGNGDFINIKGTTLLTAGSDRSGRLTLSGTFELESGAYELSFNLLKRRFDIQKGSRITWEGEPTKATVDVTAKYIATVAPIDLVKNQLSESTVEQRNIYLQRLPFEVILKMEGALLEPVFSFDIVLPNDKSYGVSQDLVTNVQTRLEQLRQEDGDMNKQVFSLLLLNRFVGDNPFAGMSNSFDAGRLARQSVSRLLSEQLNRLAADLIAGVDLQFSVQSYEDYTAGQKDNRTDLNIGLSKRLLNDRLTVTVGSNFAIEGAETKQDANNIAGDVALDYKISRDGRYILRTYRKNDYYGVLEGYVIETGVGFIVTLDYNRFRQIFQSSARRQERQERRRNRAQQQ